jgi:hypothetical protein
VLDEPLSKRLLPFHERFLYRKIPLSGSVQTAQLAVGLEAYPSKGKYIKELAIPKAGLFEDEDKELEKVVNSMKKILPVCLNLEVLNIRPSLLYWNSFAMDLIGLLGKLPLKRLKVTMVDEMEEFLVDLDDLAFVQDLLSLTELVVNGWDIEAIDGVRMNETFALVGIRSLTVDGIFLDEYSLKRVVELCPSLLHLRINTYFLSELPLNVVIPSLPTSLVSLAFEGKNSDTDNFCDAFLPRFTSLRSIELDNCLFSPSVHLALGQLPLLEKIQLGNGTLDFEGFRSLIEGPSRLRHLRQVNLVLYQSAPGVVRLEPRRSPNARIFSYRSPKADEGWPKPQKKKAWLKTVENIANLIEAAQFNGVVVNADISKFESYRQDYSLEKLNHSILDAYYNSNFERISSARRAAKDYSWLPPQEDDDNLDQTRLELVETEVPELDWFVLSLRNKVEGDE